MSQGRETFDPYHKWLGIPPHEQPPHYYRLLGLSPFEQDADVIDRAADGRMAMLRAAQTGPHMQWSQALLTEISAARNCLLNPEFKRRYDVALAGAMQPATIAVEPEPPEIIRQTQTFEQPAYAAPHYHRRSYRRRGPGRTGDDVSVLLFKVALGGIVGLVIAYGIGYHTLNFDPLQLLPPKPTIKAPQNGPPQTPAPKKAR